MLTSNGLMKLISDIFYSDGINYKRPLQNEILASWNRRRSFDDDMMNTETETIEITVNESDATGITSSEYQDDVTCEFASSQMNSQVSGFFTSTYIKQG